MTSLGTESRRVFDRHHRQQSGSRQIYARLVSLISPEYFGVFPDGFRDLHILDAGCGSNANASFAFLSQGAASVTSMDVGSAWMDCARGNLASFGERSRLISGDLMDPQLAPGEFDFVHCAGVLHHTAHPKVGFDALARMTKRGGFLYVSIMGTGNGLLYEIINFLRDKYAQDPEFRRLINNASAERIEAAARQMAEAAVEHGDATEEEARFFVGLFDLDLLLTLKDRLEAPTYHGFAFTEAQVGSWFREAGFTAIRRITRYTKGFRNLRRFLAPLYFDYESGSARLLFGEGYIQMIGRRET